MAHIVILEDEQGDISGVRYYCSDACAKTDSHYNGWYGCSEPLGFPCPCEACGEMMEGHLMSEWYPMDEVDA